MKGKRKYDPDYTYNEEDKHVAMQNVFCTLNYCMTWT